MSDLKKYRLPGGVLMLMLLSGCGTGSLLPGKAPKPASLVTPVSAPAPEPVVTPLPQTPPSATGVAACDRELQALKKVDAARYTRRKAQFDRLMGGAAAYTGIRGEVAGQTREAVDAMYRYRTGVLCAEIARDVLEGLTKIPGGTGL